MPREPQKINRVREHFYLLYDFDLIGRQTYLRVYLTVREDGVTIPTPKPSLYEARLGKLKPLEIPRREGLEPRQFNCCFANRENPEAEVNRIVYNPYRPNTGEWKGLTKELINYPEVLAVEYRGETHKSDYEDFIA